MVSPSTRELEQLYDEAIDIGTSNALDIARAAQQINTKLNHQIGRLIDRDPNRSVSVILRWLAED